MLTLIVEISMSTSTSQAQLPSDWAFLQNLSPQELDHLLYGEYNYINISLYMCCAFHAQDHYHTMYS